MSDDLAARLEGHARAFDGLLSLLPPDLYYGRKHTFDEHERKPLSKAEKKRAKREKLNPATATKTAKDVADERELKRKLQEEEGYDSDSKRIRFGLDSLTEQPGEGMKRPKTKPTKKDGKKSDNTQDESSMTKEERELLKAAKEGLKRKNVLMKKDEREEKRQEKKRLQKKEEKAALKAMRNVNEQPLGKVRPGLGASDASKRPTEQGGEAIGDDEEATGGETEMDTVDVSGLIDTAEGKGRASSSRSASPAPEFSPYNAYNNGATTPLSSINDVEDSTSVAKPLDDGFLRPSVPASAKISEISKPASSAPTSSTHITPPTSIPHETAEEASKRKADQLARLKAAIEAKQRARNADGLDGKQARSRSELQEARRIKEQKRKERKKEERKRLDDEERLASLRGSPSIMGDIFKPRSRSASVSSPSTNSPNSFSFGRVAFTDGSRFNQNASDITDYTKTKGPSDAKTALLAAEKHQAKLASLDPAKRNDLEEKDMWLNARKKINGEKIRDDVNLLKKSLKRKEKMKSRSEKQWNERIDGVKKGQEARQRKREENIAKRKEEKGGGGKKKKGGAKTGAGVKKNKKKPQKRAGFEGTFGGRA